MSKQSEEVWLQTRNSKTKTSCTNICRDKAAGRPTPSYWHLVLCRPCASWGLARRGCPTVGVEPASAASLTRLPLWNRWRSDSWKAARQHKDWERQFTSSKEKRKSLLSAMYTRKMLVNMEASSWKHSQKMYFEARKMLHFPLKVFFPLIILFCVSMCFLV